VKSTSNNILIIHGHISEIERFFISHASLKRVPSYSPGVILAPENFLARPCDTWKGRQRNPRKENPYHTNSSQSAMHRNRTEKTLAAAAVSHKGPHHSPFTHRGAQPRQFSYDLVHSLDEQGLTASRKRCYERWCSKWKMTLRAQPTNLLFSPFYSEKRPT